MRRSPGRYTLGSLGQLSHEARIPGTTRRPTRWSRSLPLRSRTGLAVRKAGGFVLVQDRSTSEHFGMPCSAIATRKPDLVLPLGEIAYALEVLTRTNAGARPARARRRASGTGSRHNVC